MMGHRFTLATVPVFPAPAPATNYRCHYSLTPLQARIREDQNRLSCEPAAMPRAGTAETNI